MRVGLCSQMLKNISTYAEIVKLKNSEKHTILWLQTSGVFSIAPNGTGLKISITPMWEGVDNTTT